MKVGFVILNYISFDDTIAAVSSLVGQLAKDNQPRKADIHIVVVDNDSPNDSQQELGSYIDTRMSRRLEENNIEIQLVAAGINEGYGAGNNIGLARLFQVAGCDVVFVVNSDVVIQKIDLQELIGTLRGQEPLCIGVQIEQPTTVNERIVGGAVFCPWTFRSRNIYDARVLDGKRRSEVVYISGAFFGMNAALFELTRGFWEEYFLYYEELDLFYRVRKCSNKWPGLAILKNWVVRHEVGGSTGNSTDARKKSAIAEYYSSRARLLFARRHLRRFMPIALAYNAVLLADRARRGNWVAARSILKGSIDGIREIDGKRMQLHINELRSRNESRVV